MYHSKLEVSQLHRYSLQFTKHTLPKHNLLIYPDSLISCLMKHQPHRLGAIHHATSMSLPLPSPRTARPDIRHPHGNILAHHKLSASATHAHRRAAILLHHGAVRAQLVSLLADAVERGQRKLLGQALQIGLGRRGFGGVAAVREPARVGVGVGDGREVEERVEREGAEGVVEEGGRVFDGDVEGVWGEIVRGGFGDGVDDAVVGDWESSPADARKSQSGNGKEVEKKHIDGC
ncbi:hypothetical protein EDC01DRAFT_67388 [Geopyxis carbonaria]|nr:hypothetical protein EDC01DRAFT_67388 [Geopyxis carbonaria]